MCSNLAGPAGTPQPTLPFRSTQGLIRGGAGAPAKPQKLQFRLYFPRLPYAVRRVPTQALYDSSASGRWRERGRAGRIGALRGLCWSSPT